MANSAMMKLEDLPNEILKVYGDPPNQVDQAIAFVIGKESRITLVLPSGQKDRWCKRSGKWQKYWYRLTKE